jgi:hypothetical protein
VREPYLWLRVVHIFAFTAWMAAMWYLPRLFVYHRGLPFIRAERIDHRLFPELKKRLSTPPPPVRALPPVETELPGAAWPEAEQQASEYLDPDLVN